MSVHRVHAKDLGRDVFTISAQGTWLPGSYESDRAARYAFRFCVDLLAELQKEAAATHAVITLERLHRLRAERGFRCGEGAHR